MSGRSNINLMRMENKHLVIQILSSLIAELGTAHLADIA